LEFIHDCNYIPAPDPGLRLPVVTSETIFAINQTISRSRYLVAARRQAYAVTADKACAFSLRREMRSARPEEYIRWRAWQDQYMTAIIQAGTTLFAGGAGKVYATAGDGKELWSAPVPGTVSDLAFNAGRLLVATDTGTIVCFAAGAGP
jgi:outer membrane protein assembly factor BamB